MYYYFDDSDGMYILSLEGGKYIISAGDEMMYSDSYTNDAETGEVNFSGDESFSAVLGENALSLVVDGTGRAFKAYTYFDVTYTNGSGNVLYKEKVLNGRCVEGYASIFYDTGCSSGFERGVYYFSSSEYLLNDEGMAYAGNFWYYDRDGNVADWVWKS